MALAARTEGLTSDRVDCARLRDRSIVHTWAMRGTLHLISAEDHGWLVPLVMEPRLSNAHRRLQQEGVMPKQSRDALRWIERMLERDGPLARAEIAERLEGHGIRTTGQGLAHLLWLAAARGLICYGPDRGREQRFILVRDWLEPPRRLDTEAALGELGTRYLRSHAPARPADLASWSGVRLTDAKRAWRKLGPRLTELSTARGARWSLRTRAGPLDDSARGPVRLLPSFDEYLLGWRDREWIATKEGWRAINRGGGWLRPVILDDGRAVGTWTTTQAASGLRLRAHLFGRRPARAGAGIAAEAEALAGFLGTPISVEVDRGGPTAGDPSGRRSSGAGHR
jgi:hypothetical protein